MDHVGAQLHFTENLLLKLRMYQGLKGESFPNTIFPTRGTDKYLAHTTTVGTSLFKNPQYIM